ncbi:MAG: FAD-dependent oxidoreductase, partial [Cyclobacteriaceae bacterium]|nr:FAD-dependent oxidoreductase [Cyclobacteriaceae bacterium]
MKTILILGGGTAGTMMANKLRKQLPIDDYKIQVIDKDENHYYQPGFLFIPFGIYQPEEVVKKKNDLFAPYIDFILAEVDRIEVESNLVNLKNGATLYYDVLIIATGSQVVPEETPQLMGKLWYKDIFDFYTYEGS